MDRRDFLKLAALSGLAVSSPLALARRAEAEPYAGTFFVTVNAAGGWDPTSLCDPKGRLSDEEENPMNMFRRDDIAAVGPFQVAPFEGLPAFFEKHRSDLLVVNGVDTETNGHDSGSRHIWSGHLQEGHPSFAAMAASVLNKEAPMAFLSNGGYDVTAGLVARTRSGSTDALARIAFPNRPDPNREDVYHTENTAQRIRDAQAARLDKLKGEQHLLRVQHAMNTLYTARLGQSEVRRLTEFLPDPLDNSNNPLRRQAQVAIAAYKAGLCVSANLSVGGFDTHSNHDQNHVPRMQALVQGVDFLLDEAERQGVRDQLMVMVGSDFGRTPGYNDGRGKDHWPVTSLLFIGHGIRGGRVIGGTTDRHGLMRVNPTTLAALPDSDATGTRIKPAHIHRNLRRMVGIDGDTLDRMYPLVGLDKDLDLFG